jgi:hypothetical protein
VGVDRRKEFRESVPGEPDALARRSMTCIAGAWLQSEALPVHRNAVGCQDVQIEDPPPRQVAFERNGEPLDRRSRLRGDKNSVRPEQVRACDHKREVHVSCVEGRQAPPHQRLEPRAILVRAGEIRARDHNGAGPRFQG